MKNPARFSARGYKKQQGVVLFIALIVMIAMTMAGLALIRSSDTSNVISGNIAFRQSALQEADTGIDAAFNALTNALSPAYVSSGNRSVVAAPKYYPIMQTTTTAPALPAYGAPTYITAMTPSDAVDISDVYPAGVGPNGNRVRYVIERMCNNVPATGLPPSLQADITANCVTRISSNAVCDGCSSNALSIQLGQVSTSSVYYRITVRVDGPRDTVSVVQAIVRS